MRTTRTELERLAVIVSRITGTPLMVQWGYGQPRLFSADGSREYSPRLPSGELAQYMRAMYQGAELALRGVPDSTLYALGRVPE